MPIQWLTTLPSGKAHTCETDDGVTGWRTHAVEADEATLFKDIRDRRALCGLRPRHGWGMDLFIEDKCARCRRVLEKRPTCNPLQAARRKYGT